MNEREYGLTYTLPDVDVWEHGSLLRVVYHGCNHYSFEPVATDAASGAAMHAQHAQAATPSIPERTAELATALSDICDAYESGTRVGVSPSLRDAIEVARCVMFREEPAE